MKSKIDLSYLKKYISELETHLTNADEVSDKRQYLTELAKCAGLAFAAAEEASALVADINYVMRAAQNPAKASPSEILQQLLKGDKGGKGSGGSSASGSN